MPANNSSMHLGYLAGKYQGKIGWLLSPGGYRRPHKWLPYAVDNGAFAGFDEQAFLDLIRHIAAQVALREIEPPLWVIVPDVVAHRAATLESWERWAPQLKAFGWPLAFAVQDGMTQADVPKDAEVIFVGGSTKWKWNTAPDWCRDNARVHVGRVNGYRWLWYCDQWGVESTDGTGFFRGDMVQLAGLEQYLRESTGGGLPTSPLFSGDSDVR